MDVWKFSIQAVNVNVNVQMANIQNIKICNIFCLKNHPYWFVKSLTHGGYGDDIQQSGNKTETLANYATWHTFTLAFGITDHNSFEMQTTAK